MPATWRLALPMYNVVPEVGALWQQLLQAVVRGLRSRGWQDDFQIVAETGELLDFWRAPDVLLSQTCGYPLMTELGASVRVLAAPAFELPGCDGVLHTSFVVVPEEGARSLEELRGKVAAVNQPHSNSGMNALRHTIAPLARAGRFFSEVRYSGGHMASMAMLQQGQADVATIDCVTYGLAARHAPDTVRGLRVLQQSPAVPGLPLITSRRLGEAQAQVLHTLLLELAQTEPALCAQLCLRSFHAAHQADYTPVLHLRQAAIQQGYPAVA